MTKMLLLLPGDGIGPEVIAEVRRLIEVLRADGLALEVETAPFGGALFLFNGLMQIPRRARRRTPGPGRGRWRPAAASPFKCLPLASSRAPLH
jgi:hypothetical protein